MKIIKYSLGQLQANCYFLVEGDRCLIIDPADEASFILEELQRRKLKLVGMLATHGHFDHIGAAGEIQLSFNIPLYIFKEDRFLVNRVEETAKYFLDFKPVILPIKNIKNLNIENSLKIVRQLADWKLKIIKTPGHTPGGCTFYFPKEKIVFTGDTLFRDGIGRYDFSYCNKKDLKNSLITLSKLSEETKVYPGHGEKTSIKEEQNNLRYYINIL
jgi:glyoxylase-like metal-dependent hydrolase (beta-lactamase superfamily II)